MKIAILLPYKENYTKKLAGAASLWVHDYNKYSKLSKGIIIYGNLNDNLKPLSKNFKNIQIKTKLFSKTKEYTNKFLKLIIKKKPNIIEIHNRPESVHMILNAEITSELILVFHNNPLELNGSKSISERITLLEKCFKIFFVSNWVKNKFFENLPFTNKNNCEIIHPWTSPLNKFPKKEHIITFSGKLNYSKGYDLFSDVIPKILNKHKLWKAVVLGSEPREKIILNHPRIKKCGWVSFNEASDYYKQSSIVVVPSRWEEPFGRTAMEGAANGCATIISNRGGLKETFNVQKKLILKKLDTNNLFKIIDTCIKNKFFLKKVQKQNFSNVLHKVKLKIPLIDTIKLSSKYKINFFNNKKIKILHIGNFNEKNSHRLFNISISNKITNGMIRNDCDVINFDYRNYFNITKKCNEKIIEIVDNYNPQLILFGHNNLLQRQQLEYIKKIKIKTAIWFEDSLHEKGPDSKDSLSLIEQNHDLIDNYFVTTSPDKIITKIPKNKINFIPVPADPNIENLEIYKYKNRYKDIFFGMSHGVNFGKLKKNIIDDRELFIKKLMYENPNISFELLGINNEQPKWGMDFFRSLSKCKMALNLSRGEPVKYYSSNRIASYTANGIATLIDIRTNYNKFFNDDEMIFYKNFKDLSKILNEEKFNEKKINSIGKKGKARYLKIFNNYLVSNFILAKTLNKKINKNIVWD